MRILVLTPDFPPGRGGIQHLIGRCVDGLDRDEVTVVTLRAPAPERDHAAGGRRVISARVLTLPRLRRLGHRANIIALNAAGFLAALLTRPDVVVAGHVVTVPAARAISTLLRRPYVLLLYAQEIPNRPALAAAGVEHSAVSVAISSHARDEAVRAGAPAERIAVINPGIDVPAEAPAAGDSDVRPNARPTIVTIARMVDRYKGHDVMIEAVDLLRREIPHVQWIVVGDGPEREAYEFEVLRRGLAGHVSFAGEVSDGARDRLLESADVFAMPSRVPPGGGGEGFGLVFLEAAARGVPAVAGDEGGARDAVQHGRTGLLVDPRSPAQVCEALRSLLSEPETARAMGAAARRHAESRSWEAFSGELREQLTQAAAEHGPARTAAADSGAPTRVLAVSHTAEYGGAERSLLTQLQADSAGGAIEVVVAAPEGALRERADSLGLRAVDGPAFERSFRVGPLDLPLVLLELVRAGRRLAGIARRERAALIHANSVRASLIAVAARPFGGPPVITHVRDCMPESALARAIGILTSRASAHVIANSDYAAGAYRRIAGGARPSVVYNAIDSCFEQQPAGESSGALPSELDGVSGPLLTMISQITPWKGHDIAIRALAETKNVAPRVKLAVAGSVKFTGDTRFDNLAHEAALHELAARLEVSEDVIFIGEVDDVRPLLSASDILLMPSWEEPFGRAAIEAMACGCAVVATSVGGPAEFIEHGVNGMLADPRDLGAWTSAIETLLSDDELRRAIGLRARQDALRRFSAGSAETRLVGVYEAHAAARTRAR